MFYVITSFQIIFVAFRIVILAFTSIVMCLINHLCMVSCSLLNLLRLSFPLFFVIVSSPNRLVGLSFVLILIQFNCLLVVLIPSAFISFFSAVEDHWKAVMYVHKRCHGNLLEMLRFILYKYCLYVVLIFFYFWTTKTLTTNNL